MGKLWNFTGTALCSQIFYSQCNYATTRRVESITCNFLFSGNHRDCIFRRLFDVTKLLRILSRSHEFGLILVCHIIKFSGKTLTVSDDVYAPLTSTRPHQLPANVTDDSSFNI